jgi:3-hydroxyanthranilate 3,4-dioxygenase
MAPPAPPAIRPLLAPFNFRAWINAHRDQLKPPVANRQVFRDSEFIIMVVGGPNSRTDFHVDPGEEFFHQLEGDMVLRTVQGGRIVDLPIREGEIFLLPAFMPHSPQRLAHTIGLVIERVRRPDEKDGLQWYCEKCHTLLFEDHFHLTNIETQLQPVFEKFYGSVELRTCRHCGEVARVPA